MAYALGLIILGYLMGSIPTGYWLVKALKGIDVRTVGSGSTGATNVLRAAGKGAAAVVLFIDAAKGFVPVWLSIYLEGQGLLSGTPMPELHLIPPAVMLAALVGHSKSIFLKFQGGKSAATGLGVIFALDALAAAITFAIWGALVYLTRIVSQSSIVAVWACALLMVAFHDPPSYVGCCVIGAALVTLRHKANIQRLLAGTEPRIGRTPPQAVSSPPPPESSESAGSPG